MFDISLYNHIKNVAIYHLEGKNNPFSAMDIVHEIYLDETFFDLETALRQINRTIKKEISKSVSFTLNHKIYDDTYVCCKCKEPIPVSGFRIRTEIRESYFDYINSCCILCERKGGSDYHAQNKNDSFFKEKAAIRARLHHWANRTEVLKKQKKRRESAEAKQIRKEYNARNREKIRCQAKDARIKRNKAKSLLSIT